MNKQEIENKLDEIYETYIGDNRHFPSGVKDGLREAYNFALELAAEKAKIKNITSMNCEDHTPYMGACGNCGNYHNFEVLVGSKIDKQSILDLKL